MTRGGTGETTKDGSGDLAGAVYLVKGIFAGREESIA
jgi:hypothetical protein